MKYNYGCLLSPELDTANSYRMDFFFTEIEYREKQMKLKVKLISSNEEEGKMGRIKGQGSGWFSYACTTGAKRGIVCMYCRE